MSKNVHFAIIENLGDHHECFPAAGVLGGNIASKLESSLFMRELCCIEIKVKAGDSEEFDHGALIVGNIDNDTLQYRPCLENNGLPQYTVQSQVTFNKTGLLMREGRQGEMCHVTIHSTRILSRGLQGKATHSAMRGGAVHQSHMFISINFPIHKHSHNPKHLPIHHTSLLALLHTQ